jgi:hypothetical protein
MIAVRPREGGNGRRRRMVYRRWEAETRKFKT